MNSLRTGITIKIVDRINPTTEEYNGLCGEEMVDRFLCHQIKINPEIFSFIENPSDRVIAAAIEAGIDVGEIDNPGIFTIAAYVKKDHNNYLKYKNTRWMEFDHCKLKLIESNPYVIQHIENPTDQMIDSAIMFDHRTLFFVKQTLNRIRKALESFLSTRGNLIGSFYFNDWNPGRLRNESEMLEEELLYGDWSKNIDYSEFFDESIDEIERNEKFKMIWDLIIRSNYSLNYSRVGVIDQPFRHEISRETAFKFKLFFPPGCFFKRTMKPS